MGPLLPALLCLLPFPGHPDSASVTRLVAGPDGVDMEQELQVLSLLEVLPGLDRDGDAWLDADEVAAGLEEVRAYVAAHYRVEAVGPAEAEGGTSLRWSPLELRAGPDDGLELLPPDPGAFLPTPDTVRLRARWVPGTDAASFTGSFERLRVSLDLFLDTSPAHLDRVEVRWPDARPAAALLSAGEPTWVAVRGPSLVARSLGQGVLAGGLGLTGVLGFLLWTSARRPGRDAVLALLALGIGTAAALRGLPAALGLDPGVGSLALAVGTAYLGADAALARVRRGRGAEAVVLGLAAGLALGAHPELGALEAAWAAPRRAFLLAGLLVPLLVAALGVRLVARWMHPPGPPDPNPETSPSGAEVAATGELPGPGVGGIPMLPALLAALSLSVFVARAVGWASPGL